MLREIFYLFKAKSENIQEYYDYLTYKYLDILNNTNFFNTSNIDLILMIKKIEGQLEAYNHIVKILETFLEDYN